MPTGFASLDRVLDWPPSRSAPRPDRLERSIETLSGVGPALTKKLAKLGIRTIGDLLEHRPFRYEPALPERRIVDLFGEEEAVIAGEVRSARLQRARRLQLVKARIAENGG